MTVIFDLDGTLLDTPAGIVSAVSRSLEQLGHPEPDAAEVRALIGKPLHEMLTPFVGESQLGQAVELYRHFFATDVVPRAKDLIFEGIEDLLEGLRPDHFLAIATSKYQVAAETIVEAAGLSPHFDLIAGGDRVTASKPAPDLALFVSGALGLPSEHCVVVGDSVHDMGMGKAAGMTTVGVTWGVDQSADLLRAGAQSVCMTVDSLRTVLTDGLLTPTR